MRCGEAISCATDLYGSPTYVTDLASTTRHLFETNECGIIHCVGPDTLDRFSFAVQVARFFGLDVSLVKPTTSEESYSSVEKRLGTAAKRGIHLGMDSTRIELRSTMRGIISALQHWLENDDDVELPVVIS